MKDKVLFYNQFLESGGTKDQFDKQAKTVTSKKGDVAVSSTWKV